MLRAVGRHLATPWVARMHRRQFVTLLATAAGGPSVVWAQQPSAKRVSVLMPLPEGDPGGRVEVEAFTMGLRELGWVEGRNVAILFRWAERRSERAAEIAAE